ncbi:calcium-binding protein [Methylobacterium sp. WCS2018Hpa-22]|uniref:calcium-binding protein n=1 Tax=Methylobacterium sp. WCS2018Hpa-22 TaxID=3073633 RepID=UPI00288C3B11|nr:calcium-binding protein [Methylobacterium sp. WCS2018Hpa-22]
MGTRYVRSDVEATAAGAAGVELTTSSTGLTDVYVYGDVNITSSDDDGIKGLGSEHDALIGGFIIGDINGVRLGDNRSTDHDNRVIIYSGAAVVGINSAGVAVNGYNSIVDVEGEIQGDLYGVLMSGVSTKFKSTIINDGEIYANSYGVAHSLTGGDTEGLVLRNTGRIEAELFSFYGGDTNSAADRIVNSGVMIGDVAMGGGNDVYDAREGGTIVGSVYGGLGDDRFVGTAGRQTFAGDAGNDRLDGGRGYDILIGGIGDDTYVVNNTINESNPDDPEALGTIYGDQVVEGKSQGIDTILANFAFDLNRYENVENGTLTSLSQENSFGGSVFGNALANVVTGNGGQNVIDGREGADQMIGLGGNDTYYADNIGDRIAEEINGGIDEVRSSATFSLGGSQVENLTLTGEGAINGTGNSLSNIIYGNFGANVINGGAGSDAIFLTNLYGADDDTIVFSSTLGINNVDTISAFNGNLGDVIQLNNSIFTTLSDGALLASAYQAGNSDVAANADVRIIYNQASQTLLYDQDGNGSATAIAFAKMSSSFIDSASFFVI